MTFALYHFTAEELNNFLNYVANTGKQFNGNMEVYNAFCELMYQAYRASALHGVDPTDFSTRLAMEGQRSSPSLKVGLRHAYDHLLSTTALTHDKMMSYPCPGAKYAGETIGQVLQTPAGYGYLKYIQQEEDCKMDQLTRDMLGDLLVKYKPKDFLDLACPGSKYEGKTVREVLGTKAGPKAIYWYMNNFDNLDEDMRAAMQAWFDAPENAKVLAAIKKQEAWRAAKAEREAKKAKLNELPKLE
jgi:hypothetical protein